MLPSTRRRVLSRALTALLAAAVAVPLVAGTAHAAPANDSFADAEAITLPGNLTVDLSAASVEPGEPESCSYNRTDPSVWYTFTTPTSRLIEARVDNWGSGATVYTGDSVADLSSLGCTQGGTSSLVFRAEPGVVYRVQLSGRSTTNLVIGEAGPIRVDLVAYGAKHIYEPMGFEYYAYTSANIVSGEWDFGDGTRIPLENYPSHRYAADGVYRVKLTVVADDGRVGSDETDVEIRTHDVGVTAFDVPKVGYEGESKRIAVHVANTRYDESVTVVLRRNAGGYDEEVARLTLDVPADPTRTVKFPFAYTFSPRDAVQGKVTFSAEVRIADLTRDARPQDNDVTAIATTVRPPRTAVLAAA